MEQITALLLKYISGELAADEKEELEEWKNASPANEAFFNKLIAESNIKKRINDFYASDSDISRETVFRKIAGKIDPTPVVAAQRVRLLKTAWFRYVAALILIASAGGLWWFLSYMPARPGQTPISLHKERRPYKDRMPGGAKATLTLADNSVIVLDSATPGTLASQGNTIIIKRSPGELAYVSDGIHSAPDLKEGYNTITTPRGGKYNVVLPDGSRVWLNAASSLRFPTRFKDDKRWVEVTGEAYFDIAPERKRGTGNNVPFYVKANGVEVQVLGTKFNVNVYEDEPIYKITLLEGSVKVMVLPLKDVSPAAQESLHEALLSPGRQVCISRDRITTQEADLDAETAWKNDQFSFQHADIGSVMRQISKWYDVEVEYKDHITELFTGNISRKVKASQVFKMLELTGLVHFTIEDGKVIVRK